MTYVVGIDPGPTPGAVGLLLNGAGLQAVDVWQCNGASALLWVLDGLYGAEEWPSLVSIEAFVVGPRAARSSTPEAGRVTRELIGRVAEWTEAHKVVALAERRAADVKPWATDTRLSAAGLLEPTRGMRHARDAARHALFAAVKDCGLRDPLSRKASA